MKTELIKFPAVAVVLLLFALSQAVGANAQTMPGGGMPGGGGRMMGGSTGRMGQFVVADLNNDNVPEVVSIVSGKTLVIMDNKGTVLSSKPLPSIPGLTNEWVIASGLQVADMDGDGTPDIVTTYFVTNMGYNFEAGTSTKLGTYLVVLDSQGNLKDVTLLQLP